MCCLLTTTPADSSLPVQVLCVVLTTTPAESSLPIQVLCVVFLLQHLQIVPRPYKYCVLSSYYNTCREFLAHTSTVCCLLTTTPAESSLPIQVLCVVFSLQHLQIVPRPYKYCVLSSYYNTCREFLAHTSTVCCLLTTTPADSSSPVQVLCVVFSLQHLQIVPCPYKYCVLSSYYNTCR